MPTFLFEAQDNQGRTVKDSIDAPSAEAAREQLRSKKLAVISISQRPGNKKGPAKKGAAAAPERKRTAAMGGVNGNQLTLFTRQFATLLDAGLAMTRALGILENMLPPGVLRNAVMDVRDDVDAGSSLSESMAKRPKAFDTLYVSMIRAGEAAGQMDTILIRLAEFREKASRLKKQIIGALIYPAAVMSIAGAILILIVLLIVPKFKTMFDGLKIEMPIITQMLMGFADGLMEYWYLLPGVPVFIIATFKLIKMSPAGQYALDKVALYLPVFGIIIRKSSISRFCRTLGTLTSSGVPILDALAIIRTGVGNKVVEEAVNNVHDSIRSGETVSEPLKRFTIFDGMMVSMIEVGEETGELDKMLIKISDNYDADVDTLVSGMMSLLEPFLIIGMGGAVAFIVIALFMPLISIMENMSGG